MVWMLLAACAGETEGEGTAGGMDLAGFLDEEVLAGIPERAWLKAEERALIGWGAGAIAIEAREEIGGSSLYELLTSPGLPVFAIEEDALGLVDERGGVRLLVTVPRSMLRTVAVEETLAVPDPGRLDPADPLAPGVILPAGWPLAPGDEGGDFVHLAYAAAPLEWAIWAPVAGVDHFARVGPEGGHGGTGDLWLEAGTELLDAPGGRRFATAYIGHPVRRLQPAADGFVLVESAKSPAKVRGYVPAPAEEPMTVWGWGSGGWAGTWCGLIAHFEDESAIPAGTRLHLSPGGPVVGEVLRELDAPVMDREDGWEAVEIETRWGPVDLWIAP